MLLLLNSQVLRPFYGVLLGLMLLLVLRPGHALAATEATKDDGFFVGVQSATPEKIHAVLPGTAGKPVFLEFKSKFCLACKKMDPILEELLPQYPDIDQRVFDMMKDRVPQKPVFDTFKPSVVPIQLYINRGGKIVNVFYDFHDKKALKAALDCINPPNNPESCNTGIAAVEKETFGNKLEKQINETIKAGSVTTVILAFLAGIISSFFPCTLAMLPVLIGYMGAYSSGSRRDVLLQGITFILGLSTVMTVLGILLSYLGMTFGAQNSAALYYGIGGLCIVMSLQMMELLHLPLPSIVKTLPETQQGKLITFYVLGCTFGLVASPCGTPILAAILGIISKQGNLFLGGVSLFAYAIGQGLLLLAVGLFTGLLKYKAAFFKVGSVLTRISGVIILVIGIVFILQAASIWVTVLRALHLESLL